jgi:prepilin-type N-terminal cleavage/methylation domain-containing protein
MGYNKSMKKGRQKRGFTLIEVALVLGITGLIFAIVMSNTANRVASRRYFDAVNELAETLRNAYSSTINVENYRRKNEDASFFCSITSAFEGNKLKVNSSSVDAGTTTDNYPGRTRCAIYGQLITFGEDSKKGSSNIYRYDIIGVAKTDNLEPGDGTEAGTNDDILVALGKTGVGANVVTIKQQGNNISKCSKSIAGTFSSYQPQYGAKIEQKSNRELYKGAIMITRSPLSGTVHTYFYNKGGALNFEEISIEDSTAYNASGIANRSYNDNFSDDTFAIQEWLSAAGPTTCAGYYKSDGYFLEKVINDGRMVKDGNLDLCIGSDDLPAVGDKRRAIRIHGDGSTESSVEVLTERDSVKVCSKNGVV